MALVGAVAGLVLISSGAGADSALGGFTATAEASGMYTRYGIPGFFIVDNYVDGGAPVAQSLLDSAGTSQSFASYPYPGATAVGYPGLAALALGSAPPGYPFYASASYPTQPEGSVGDAAGPYVLTAKAQAQQATSDARAGLSRGADVTAAVSQAKSDITVDADRVTSTSTSLAQGIAAGPLSIGSVKSASLTTYRAGDQASVTQTDMQLEGGRAGTYQFSFGRDGLKINDQGIPLPAKEGLASLNQALAPTGFTIRFEEPNALTGGATAAAFEIVNTRDVPGAGRGTLFVRFGGATSAVAPGAPSGLPSVPAVPAGASAPGGDSGGTVAPAAPVSVPEMPAPAGDGGAGVSGAGRVGSGAAGVAAPGGFVPTGSSAGNGLDGPAPVNPVENAAPALPSLRRAQLLASPREFDAPSVLSAALLAGGLLALGALVAWRASRRVAQWTA